MNTRSTFHSTQRRHFEKGSAYVEYFLAAAAMAAAAMWFFQDGNYQGVRGTLDGTFTTQMRAIAGPVR